MISNLHSLHDVLFYADTTRLCCEYDEWQRSILIALGTRGGRPQPMASLLRPSGIGNKLIISRYVPCVLATMKP